MAQLHVIWDLDGTLINSEEEVLEALIKSVKDAGLTEKDQIVPFRVGPTIDKILDATFSKEKLTPVIKDLIIKNFRLNYDNCGFNRTLAFDGIEAILRDERFVHHIVTNKPDLATDRILEKLNWKDLFADVITPYTFIKSSDDPKKTKTELFAWLKEKYTDEKFAGVGDMETDAVAAKNNDMIAVGVLWGTGTECELKSAGCKPICISVEQLKNELEGML